MFAVRFGGPPSLQVGPALTVNTARIPCVWLSRLQLHHMVCPPELLSPGGLLCRPHFRVRPVSSGNHLGQAEQEEEGVWTPGRARWNLVSLSPVAVFMGKCGEDGVCDVLLSRRSVFPSQAILHLRPPGPCCRSHTAQLCRVGNPGSDMTREVGFQCPCLPGGSGHASDGAEDLGYIPGL